MKTVLVGLTVAVVILVGYLLYRVSQLDPGALEATTRGTETRLSDLRQETGSLQERLHVLGGAAHEKLSRTTESYRRT